MSDDGTFAAVEPAETDETETSTDEADQAKVDSEDD